MEDFLNVHFSWSDFFLTAIILFALYFALRFIRKILNTFRYFGTYQETIKQIVKNIFLLFEPMAILILLTVFVLVNPVFHGLLVALVLIAGFTHVRNYINGRLFLLNNELQAGRRMKSGKIEGVIIAMERLGLKIRTNQGLNFLGYQRLMSNGYLLLSGEEIGGFYHLVITPKEENLDQIHLSDRLMTAPYLDWNHIPEIWTEADASDKFHTKVMVKEENHLKDLLILIKGWGYDCQTLTKKI